MAEGQSSDTGRRRKERCNSRLLFQRRDCCLCHTHVPSRFFKTHLRRGVARNQFPQQHDDFCTIRRRKETRRISAGMARFPLWTATHNAIETGVSLAPAPAPKTPAASEGHSDVDCWSRPPTGSDTTPIDGPDPLSRETICFKLIVFKPFVYSSNVLSVRN